MSNMTKLTVNVTVEDDKQDKPVNQQAIIDQCVERVIQMLASQQAR